MWGKASERAWKIAKFYLISNVFLKNSAKYSYNKAMESL
jgi:hypothetical protein